jgi:hypothetical protein
MGDITLFYAAQRLCNCLTLSVVKFEKKPFLTVTCFSLDQRAKMSIPIPITTLAKQRRPH